MNPADLGLLVLGFVVLTVGADFLVRGASRLAAGFGVPALVIGLTVVAFGTSAPEVAVSVRAAASNQAGVALGNVVGSNIFNVLLVLGLSAVVAPLSVQRQLVRLDVPVLIAVSCLPLLLGWNGELTTVEGAVLLAIGVAYTGLLGWLAFRKEPAGAVLEAADPLASADAGGPGAAGRGTGAILKDVAFLGLGLVGLVAGAGWLVEGAVALAREMGVSDLVIGLTVVAAGTSLPEVATSVVASIKGERDIAVGNVVGSNIFNILFVLGAGAVVSPDGLPVPPGALTFDLPVMIVVAAACFPIFLTGWVISRWEGAVFLVYYGLYLANVLLASGDHDMDRAFDQVVVLYVVPLTVILALLGWWRGRDEEEDAPAR